MTEMNSMNVARAVAGWCGSVISFLRPLTLRAPRGAMLGLALAVAGLAAPAMAAPPPNDAPGGAVPVVTPLPFVYTQSTVEATVSADEPVGICNDDVSTVWFVFQPADAGDYLIETVGSDYDTVLSLYRGTSGSLEPLTCDDDSVWPQSRLIFSLEAGATYYIRAGSYPGTPGGSLVLNVRLAPPPAVVKATVLSTTVNPAKGHATVRVRVEASSPILLNVLRVDLRQGTGRGVVAGQAFEFPGRDGTVFEFDLLVQDRFMAGAYFRDRGTGFRGGPAELSFLAFYRDPLESKGVFFDQSVTLQGGER